MENDSKEVPKEEVKTEEKKKAKSLAAERKKKKVLPRKKSSKSRKVILGLCAVFTILITSIVGTILGIAIYAKLNEIEKKNETESMAEKSDSDQEDEADNDESKETNKDIITVDSPSSDDEVIGQIEVKGKATSSLETLKVDLYDDNSVLLGTSTFSLSSSDDDVDWTTTINVTRSPGTNEGKIQVFPASQGEGSPITQVISVKFKLQTAKDRIELFAPLENQLMSETEILFRGQMKNFFEGNMNVRLKDESGTVIFDGSISADDGNYEEFSDFEKTIDIKELPENAGTEGTWELYELSPKDGKTTVLLSIAIRFSD